MNDKELEQLHEKLAAIEHERWASWQNYLHSRLAWNNDLQCWTLLHEWKDRWQMQVNTPYAMLSEKEKQSDRDQVNRYWPLVKAAIATQRQQAAEAARREVEYEANQRAFQAMRDELERVSHPQIRVIRRSKDYDNVEQITDVQYGGDIIQVAIAALTEQPKQ